MVFPKTVFLNGKICDNEDLKRILLTQDYSQLEIFLEKELGLKLFEKQVHFYSDNLKEENLIVINTSSSNFDKFSGVMYKGDIIEKLKVYFNSL